MSLKISGEHTWPTAWAVEPVTLSLAAVMKFDFDENFNQKLIFTTSGRSNIQLKKGLCMLQWEQYSTLHYFWKQKPAKQTFAIVFATS